MASGGIVSGAKATTIIARLTFKRLFRGKGIWFTFALSLLPILIATLGGSSTGEPKEVWGATFGIGVWLYCLAPAIHLAGAVAEEFDDKTFTYLWSRPFPRWSVISGKVLAVLPTLCALFTLSFTLAFYLSYRGATGANTGMLVHGIAALWLGMATAACVCIGLGSLVPKFPMAISIIYLLIIDIAISAIPVAINKASVIYNMVVISGLHERSHDTVGAIISLLCISAVWMAVAVWRIGRAEYQTDK